jgi:(S)-ureidoglycine aminohydrolase
MACPTASLRKGEVDVSDEAPEYYVTDALLPPQTAMLSSRVVVRPTYALIPASVLADNVASFLPFWEKARLWILASPAIGFATAFAEYLVFLAADGGCDRPETEEGVEGFLFVLRGRLRLRVEADRYELTEGGFAYIPPNTGWSVRNEDEQETKLLWLRKLYEPIPGFEPARIVGNEAEIPVSYNPTTDKKWSTHLIPTDDLAYDIHMNINTFGPGTIISNVETHVMEHGLYMLQGKGVYLLNDDWREVAAGDFIWMRAFCPQAFYAGGPIPARYLLYKNVNRQVALGGASGPRPSREQG